jgi:hypothetical protein
LDQALKRTSSKCSAYSFLGNHFHSLILRGQRPLAELMRRLMTCKSQALAGQSVSLRKEDLGCFF